MSEIDSSSSGESSELQWDLELLGYCNSGSLSEEGLREIIEWHELTPNNHAPNYDSDFFFITCINERVTEGIIRYLLEYFPDAARARGNGNGWSPLHAVCSIKNVTLKIVQLIIEAAPATLRSVNNHGGMPLHYLCGNNKVDETTATEILKVLVEKYPEAARHAGNNGSLPIHTAAWRKSPEFCRVLIEAYPGSERIRDVENGALPLHLACVTNTLASIEYLVRLYPESIAHATTTGGYPISDIILGASGRENPADAVEIVHFMLDYDPNQKLIQFHGITLLELACGQQYNDSSIEAGIQMIKIIYDAHPEAIEDDWIAHDIDECHEYVQAFITIQLRLSRRAKDHRHMTTPDDNGQLPLHRAIQNNYRLGPIKLLVKGNPSALQSPDNSGRLPLHLACQHHNSSKVIEYLVDLDPSTLDAVDREENTALHLACQNAKHDTIAMLLGKYDAVSVSKGNVQSKLPIELLWESNTVGDRESIEYTESVFQLLRAYPETVMNCNSKHEVKSDDSSSESNEKKRKLDAV